MADTKKGHKRYTENRTKNSEGKENIVKKLKGNKPGTLTRTSTGMKGSMRPTNVTRRSR